MARSESFKLRRAVPAPIAGQGEAAGLHPPRTLRPVRKRKLLHEVRGEWEVSIWWAWQVLMVDTWRYRSRSRRPDGLAEVQQCGVSERGNRVESTNNIACS